ncbi:MAG: hypothetical protein Q9192_002090 [Flavoplaca navasiana]
MASGSGSKKDARDKQLAYAFDTKHVEEQKKVTERYLEAAKKAGYTYQSLGEFDNLLDNSVAKQKWLAEQKRLGQEELKLQEEDVELRREDAQEFLSLLRHYQSTIDDWKIKDEEAAESNLETYLVKGREFVQRFPKAAAKIFHDDKVRAVVDAAVKEEQSYLEDLREHFYEVGEKTQNAVVERFNELNLEQRLEDRVSRIREALDAAKDREMEYQTTLAEVLEEDEKLRDKVNKLTDSKEGLEQRLRASQAQEEKLKSDITTLNQKRDNLQQEKRVLEDDLKQTREDKEASDKKTQDANTRADGLQTQLNSLGQSNADLQLGLTSAETRLSRSVQNSKAATAAEKRRTDEKIDGLEKEKGNLEGEVAGLKAQLESERQKATQQLAQAIEREKSIAQDEKTRTQASHQGVVASLQKDLDEMKRKASQFQHESKMREMELRRSFTECQAKAERLEAEKSQLNQQFEDQSESLQTHKGIVASLQDDLQSAREETSRVKNEAQKRETDLQKLFEESQGKVQSLANEKSNLERDNQQRLDLFDQNLKGNQSRIQQLEGEKSELEGEKSKLEREKAKMVQEKQQQSDDIRTYMQQSQAKLDRLSLELSDLDTKSKEEIKRLRQQQRRTRGKLDASCLLIQFFTRGETSITGNLDLESVNALIECQRLSTVQNGRSLEHGDSRQMPRMMFRRHGQPTDPITHAIHFCVVVRSNQMSFTNSQALFNSSISQPNAAAIYPFILDALTVIVTRMKQPRLPVNHFDFSMILAILHGTAFLNYLAQAIAIESVSMDVRTLNDKVEAHLAKMLGKGSIIETVLGQVRRAMSGEPIASWLDMPTTQVVQARLDVTNSDLGAHRCIAADAATPGSFVLLDQVSIDEILYAFSKNDVEKVVCSLEIRLVFKDVFVSVRVAREIVLAEYTHGHKAVEAWVLRFLGDRVMLE